MIRIGVLGLPFHDANKGCEALAYSTVALLAKRFEGEKIEIVVFNDSKNENIEKIATNATFIYKKISIKDFSAYKIFKTCNYVLDGTCGDGFSDIYFPKNVLRTTLYKIIVNISGSRLILLPQTYGPFKSSFLRALAMFAIKHSFRVYSRDEASINYLNKHIKRKVIASTDMAFELPYNNDSNKVPHSETIIGLNVSGLLWRGGFNKDNQFDLSCDYKEYICELIERLHELKYEIHLIPHVIESEQFNLDGDVSVCSDLKRKYDYLIFDANFSTPIDAKNYISQMDCFLGARMHSTIAALSSGVPVIPFSYSRKFEGLFNQLEYPFVIHGNSVNTESALNESIEYIKNINDLKEAVLLSKNKAEFYLKNFKSDLYSALGL